MIRGLFMTSLPIGELVSSVISMLYTRYILTSFSTRTVLTRVLHEDGLHHYSYNYLTLLTGRLAPMLCYHIASMLSETTRRTLSEPPSEATSIRLATSFERGARANERNREGYTLLHLIALGRVPLQHCHGSLA